MKRVIIIGSGISGLSCAVRCAEHGIKAMLISTSPAERSQSVMAAGGINAVFFDRADGDSVECHIEDTLRGGCYIAGKNAVTGLCTNAEDIIRYLEGIGTVFTVDPDGSPAKRAFGGQTYSRTRYCGSSTGKHIVSALVMEARRNEAAGLIERRSGCCFHSALIKDGQCFGAVLFDSRSGTPKAEYADALVMATGGMNALFGKTTGSSQCDGYAAGMLFMQGADLKNLEFIQFHPTTLETPQKRMLISEAVRGEGGRLFCNENGGRVYFMEEKYGERGNLMTRDIISLEIAAQKKDVFLDISFLDEKLIDRRLPEVRELCLKYRNIDIAREPVPVAPSVHFFMGGLAVHNNHETNIRNLFAVGECASIYHGANRLGGNSLLAAVYSGRLAADETAGRETAGVHPDFSGELDGITAELQKNTDTKSRFPVMYIRDMAAETLSEKLGIVREDQSMAKGIEDIDYYLSAADKLNYDSSVPAYANYSLKPILSAARATLTCAKERKESRGAHFRSDHPEADGDYASPSIISYDGGRYAVRLDKEREYED